MRFLLLLVILFAGCSRQPDLPAEEKSKATPPPVAEIPLKDLSLDDLRQAAEGNNPQAQRELAQRLLFGQGITADPAEAIRWVQRAALNGDETASLWMGRAALNNPTDRMEAGAWFLIAAQAQSAAVQQDASGELDALHLTEEELNTATLRASEIKKTILNESE